MKYGIICLLLILSSMGMNCWANPLFIDYMEETEEELPAFLTFAPILLSLAEGNSGSTGNSSESETLWKVHRIPGFSLDGNASDFIGTESITDNNNTILATDSQGDRTGLPGTDILKVWMGHDGSNFVFFYQTEVTPTDSSLCSSGGCYYQLNISGWLINVFNSGGVAQRIGARDFFGSTSGCQSVTNSEIALVNNNPAGYYGFEIRVNPSCLDVGSSGSISTHDRSNHSLDVTADFSSIYWDRMDIDLKNVTWDFNSSTDNQ